MTAQMLALALTLTRASTAGNLGFHQSLESSLSCFED
jgi:hypothetical protein